MRDYGCSFEQFAGDISPIEMFDLSSLNWPKNAAEKSGIISGTPSVNVSAWFAYVCMRVGMCVHIYLFSSFFFIRISMKAMTNIELWEHLKDSSCFYAHHV